MPAKKVGMDEFAKRKGHKDFVTVLSDVEKGRPIEIIEGRKQEELIGSLSQRAIEEREAVEAVSIDMWSGFVQVIKKVFPNALIVYDRFHVMKHVNQELNKLRKKMKLTEKNTKYLLLKNQESLSKEEKDKLIIVFKEYPCLAIAYELKEELRRIYEKTRTVSAGRRKIEKWLRSATLFYQESGSMIEKHLEGICNYFVNRTTNGAAEGINTKIQLIKRQGYGFNNFENFKLKLLACFSD